MIIVAISLIGELLHHFISLPIPASIYGIVLLFAALQLGWIKVRQIREVSTWLIAIMPALFIPSAVGLISSWDIIKAHLLQYTVITVVSTLVVMGIAGLVTQCVIRHSHPDERRRVRQ
ncbi:MAG: CidA/LrgA family protein [Muribaculaceae bacterium]